MEVTESLISYLAGFFDGEGTIGIRDSYDTSLYLLYIAVVNTKREVLDIYKELFGGSITKTKRGENHKDAYTWKIEAKKAEVFLLVMQGRLILKDPQLRLAMKFRELFKGNNVLPRGNAPTDFGIHKDKTDQILMLRRACFDEMKVLNKRGVDVNAL